MLGDVLSGAGKIADTVLAQDNARKNRNLQREFAQSGIQWKVADAKAAGVHPLYALGASTHSFSPVSAGSDLGGAGESVGRAIHSTMAPDERGASKVMERLAVERATLQNDQLKLDIMASRNKLLSQAGTGKPIPSAGPVGMESSVDANPRLFLGDGEVRMHPGYSPTQSVENAYGDISSVYGVMKAAKDWERTYNRPFSDLALDWVRDKLKGGHEYLAGSNAWKYNYDPKGKWHPAADPRSKW